MWCKSGVIKKTVYNKVVAKVVSMQTSRFILKTKYNTDKSQIENKKFLILVILLKRLIIILKSLK